MATQIPVKRYVKAADRTPVKTVAPKPAPVRKRVTKTVVDQPLPTKIVVGHADGKPLEMDVAHLAAVVEHVVARKRRKTPTKGVSAISTNMRIPNPLLSLVRKQVAVYRKWVDEAKAADKGKRITKFQQQLLEDESRPLDAKQIAALDKAVEEFNDSYS